MKVSTQIDDWLAEFMLRQTIWVAELNNGETVYQDDNRPGLEESSAWLRLKDYVYFNRLIINSMYLKFRSHYEHVGDNVEGFFFVKGMLGGMTMKKSVNYYTVGILKDDLVFTKKFRVPELIMEEEGVRPADGSETCIIRNGYDQSTYD